MQLHQLSLAAISFLPYRNNDWFTQLASAADLGRPVYYPPLPPPPPVFSWSGCYVGGNGGYAWNNGNTHYDDPNTTADPINFRPPTIVGPVTYIPTPSGTNGAGGLGGVGAGCNLQAQQWVYGIEGDFDWGRISGSQTTSGPGVLSEYQTGPTTHFGAIAPQANEQVSLNWLSTIRPRVGFAVTERFALFATGGRCPHLRNRIVYLGGAHNCLVFPERVTSSRSQHPAVRQWRHRWVFAWEIERACALPLTCGAIVQLGRPASSTERWRLLPSPRTLEIRFVRSTWEERPDGSVWKEGKMVQPPTKQIEARPPSGSVSFGPDILKFDKC